jgi:hypothetical protein
MTEPSSAPSARDAASGTAPDAAPKTRAVLPQRRPGRAARSLTVVWALLPLLFVLPAAPCFAWAAWKLRTRALAWEACGYLAVCVGWIALANQHGWISDAGVWLAVVVAVFACARAFALRPALLGEQQAPPLTAPPASATANWTPTFPAQRLPPRDPNNPATWVAAVACTGQDRHSLSVPVSRLVGYGGIGAALVAVDVYLHVYGRGLGTGIGMMLVPVLAALFARWVDGPVLYYRMWGVARRLRLDTVTAVTADKPRAGAAAVLLSAPGLAKPLRISLRSRGYVMAPDARDHLRGWLGGPQVAWSPAAVALFDEHTTARTAPSRRRHRVLATVLTVVLPLGLAGAGAWLAYRRNVALTIPGAPGYNTMTGPHGKPLAVGRPWGHACQPVRFAVEEHVPDSVYTQIATVVAEARRDGLNVALETRDFRWTPSSVYYPAGLGPATVPRVAIFAHSEKPPQRSDGKPENIRLGWDATVDPDGRHEDLTSIDGDFWMQTLQGHPQAVRRSMRQLVAMTEGIGRATRDDSGIARDSSLDRFSPADVAAMRLMSGCGDAAAAVVAGSG